MTYRWLTAVACLAPLFAANGEVKITRAAYLDRVRAVWTAQLIAVQIGWAFEHKPAAVSWIDNYDRPMGPAPIDDDWYYEMVLLKALEEKGVGLTVDQLGDYWDRYNVGTWGSSEQARLNIRRGVRPPLSGHPFFNRLWFTMGNQCRGDLPGLLAFGLPNLAAELSRKYGHINSYAEGTDGGVLLSAMIALAPFEADPQALVRKAIRVLPPTRPHRQAIEMMISLAERGKKPKEIAAAIEDRWHTVYPATNNAVSNGALAVLGVWFGEGDFLKTVNVVFQAADYTDADCNAAFAGAVVAAMKGMAAIPERLWKPFQDRIRGDSMGHLKFPMVDESITALSERTAAVGLKFLAANGVRISGDTIQLPRPELVQMSDESFSLNEFAERWSSGWRMERAGYGAPGGGLRNLRGGTFLDGDVLSTYPADEVRGMYLWKTVSGRRLRVEVAADPGRSWQLQIFANNERVVSEVISGGPAAASETDDRPLSVPELEYVRGKEARRWKEIVVDLKKYDGREMAVRLYQTVLLKDNVPGNAYWRGLRVD
ncbi:MAG: ADP-ribosylglycohydrolase family protein [Bryobacteraceae bacterium]|nr:ADP-ribosylglycohydrolase family protein [Bryobacteraceae bacterium]